jgi:hypothetical protein
MHPRCTTLHESHPFGTFRRNALKSGSGILFYKALMEEASCGADFPGDESSIPMIDADFLKHLVAKSEKGCTPIYVDCMVRAINADIFLSSINTRNRGRSNIISVFRKGNGLPLGHL